MSELERLVAPLRLIYAAKKRQSRTDSDRNDYSQARLISSNAADSPPSAGRKSVEDGFERFTRKRENKAGEGMRGKGEKYERMRVSRDCKRKRCKQIKEGGSHKVK